MVLPLLITLFISLTTSFATSFFAQPFEKTLTEAPIIVRGKIGAAESRYSSYSDGTKHLFTFTDVEVKDRLKGADQLPARIQIREIGGEKDGVEMGVSGRAEFKTGEDVVVLLNTKAQDGSYPLKGLMMGKYTIEKDRGGNEILKGAGIDMGKGHSHDETESMGETSKIWTIQAVKEFVAENQAAEKTRPSDAPVPTLQTAADKTPAVEQPKKEENRTGLDAAPVEGTDEKNDHSGLKSALKFFVAIVIAGVFYRIKRRKS